MSFESLGRKGGGVGSMQTAYHGGAEGATVPGGGKRKGWRSSETVSHFPFMLTCVLNGQSCHGVRIFSQRVQSDSAVCGMEEGGQGFKT